MGVQQFTSEMTNSTSGFSITSGDVNVEDRAGRVLGKTRLMDSSETLVDPATEGTLSSELSREIATWNAGTLPIQEDTPLDVSAATVPTDAENSDGSSVSASTAATGSGNAAAISVPDGRTTCTAAWDVSGAATVTVEVSPDGGATWYQEHSAGPSEAVTGTHTFTTGFDDVRVYVDANLNSASIGAKGV